MSSCRGKEIRYNRGTTVGVPTERESNMYEPLDPHNIKVEHAADPIMERKTDMYGLVKVYPPAGDPSTWSEKSWKLVTEKAPDGKPLKEQLKASSVFDCFHRPYFIEDKDRFSAS